MAEFDYDFSGWATKNDYKCSDGRTIRKGAFHENHGKQVPLVWQHNHNEIYNVIGHALLEERPEGVYAYCSFNDSEMAAHARACVEHKDINALSIFAKVFNEKNKNVLHGNIKEVSLVLSGANPGAVIDNVVAHSEDGYDEMYAIYSINDETVAPLSTEWGSVDTRTFRHSDDESYDNGEDDETEDDYEDVEHADGDETVEDVLKTLNEKQAAVVEYVIEQAVKAAMSQNGETVSHSDDDNYEEESEMPTNVFETNFTEIQHSDMPVVGREQMEAILAHAKDPSCLSLKRACEEFVDDVNTLAHADSGITVGDGEAEYGIADIDWLFPNAKNLFNQPQFIKRRTEWVSVVMNGCRDVPFSRIKTMFMDITGDDARAKGYATKGARKVEEVVTLLKRETAPTTVYKKQMLDRDDIIDITDFDVVMYLKGEMRLMWEEEVARAILIGDGREALTRDKIDETKIRPIYSDDPLFTLPARVDVPSSATDDQRTKLIIRKIIKAYDDYEGAGDPVFFTTAGFLSDCLLLEDGYGRPLYKTKAELETALRVSKIVTVPVMKGVKRTVEIDPDLHTTAEYNLVGIIVNLNDYARGADKGGRAEMFEDFDIDYNQYKYLYEGRCSGALVTPYSAITVEYTVTNP